MQRLARRRRRALITCAGLALTAGMVCAPAAGAQETSDSAVLEAALQMRGAIAGVPVMRGDRWQTMSHDEKFYFVSGALHVIGIENALMSRYPDLQRDNFSGKAGEGLLGKTADGIIERVDGFYKQHADKLTEPVMLVIWDTSIRPKLKTGIAGRPLK